MRLATRDAFFEVKPTIPLSVGTRVMLQVEGSGNALRLVMHADADAPPKGAGNTSTAQTGRAPAPTIAHSAATNAAIAQSGLPPGAQSTSLSAPTAPIPPNSVIPPGATAPLGASGTAAAGTAAAAYGQAGQTTSQVVVANQPTSQTAASTPTVIASPSIKASAPQSTATIQSGSLVQSGVQAPNAPASPAPGATAATKPAPPASTTPASPSGLSAFGIGATSPPTQSAGPQPPADPVRAALSEMVHRAISRQDGLAPLFSNLTRLSSAPNRPLPDAIARAVEQLLGLRVNAGQPLSAGSIKNAVQQSGIFQEARLAWPSAPSMASSPAPPPATGDMKSSLLMLRNVLQSVLGGEAVSVRPNPDRPPPPKRHGLPNGQRPAAPTLSNAVMPQETMRVLLAQTEAALERLRLSQYASRPDDGDGRSSRAAGGVSEWNLEIPLALGQQTAIAQFVIERDGANGTDAEEQTWQVRFSIDVDPLGPVHVQLTLRAGDVTVAVWAERDEAMPKLREGVDELRESLREAELGVDDIQLWHGRPRDAATRSGSFVDRQT